ncbi:MAG: cysteine--tRNA ligase [Deltaproteobacteria bacterium]|nr:cysteine--tRNA ligase [Deltaproteobacteria bacterium]
MTLRIYNTLKKKKETFVPMEENRVGMYVCGPTVYDVCHMGHARASIVFDMIFRYLLFKGYHVTYVRNITDIDDKIIKRANEEGVHYSEITRRYIKSFHDDMLDIGNKPPTCEPKATEHIDEIIHIIEDLIKKGHAYVIDGDVYYLVESFSEYGKLSGRKTEDLISGARVDVDERKKNPLDFALWKSSKEGEPWWESPWGKGRPGWHIECSAMSCKHLGKSFDIHGGGKDLIFPHHENEVAQSEGASGKPFAKYWLHNGFVNVNEEKMSKSLGNFFTIRDILKLYEPEVLRFFLLTTHYRSPIDYSDRNLKETERALEKIYTTLKTMNSIIDGSAGHEGSGPREGDDYDGEAEELIHSLVERFTEAMDDDFNSAAAIAAIFDTVRAINRWINSHDFRRTAKAVEILEEGKRRFETLGEVMGILGHEPEQFFKKIRQKRSEGQKIDEEEVKVLVTERIRAREAKNWQKSDEIRDKLQRMGVILKDGPEGTSWEIKI